jgi:hypothetical protein
VSFLASLLLPILATVVLLHAYPERAARGLVPPQLTTTSALTRGALAGVAALLFLSALGVIILAVRGKMVTPAGIEASAATFWVTQFLLAAAIGAIVGALTALAMLPWVRARLARVAPRQSAP